MTEQHVKMFHVFHNVVKMQGVNWDETRHETRHDLFLILTM